MGAVIGAMGSCSSLALGNNLSYDAVLGFGCFGKCGCVESVCGYM